MPQEPDKSGREQPTWMIQSVVRMAGILDLFTVERPIWSEQEIVAATSLSRGTTYRFCHTLLHLGYLDKDATGRFRPGPRAMTLGQAAIGSLDVAELAGPILGNLRTELDETVNMAIPDGTDIVYVARLRGSSLIDIRLQVGSRLPAFCTSLGRAMLACRTDQDVEDFLRTAELVARTPATITDPRSLRKIIANIRDVGYAVNDGELEIGLRGVAAAIRYPDGGAAAAINVSLTRPFIADEAQRVLGPRVAAAAAQVTRLLAQSSNS